ncbi:MULTISPECIES: DUF6095 family protein [Flavobacterium]|uniref:Uncharacterized protein n=2 Tax=Flavobacterium TaxID=237 RepID=A0A437UA08_9FLAO|nr:MULTISPECIES: DUF6095 family protein [Flavobacterium]OWP83673.1 hypothetical protein BWK59_09245 [Flavobacterium davisii]QYS89267.1 hypothetical protein JJC05_02465 [Flavobacterium davisii]RVU90453.1 hypothetical protein EH230_05815 [Flavobacterium columnare]SPE78102.1 hypothetical protein FLACOL_02117 [Flavobacterium columnare]
MSTNKDILLKGIKNLAMALPLMFIGPSVIFSSFKNQNHPFYIPVLGLGITICLLSIYLMFKGIQTIMKSLFNEKR